jgi:hypothetical protein
MTKLPLHSDKVGLDYRKSLEQSLSTMIGWRSGSPSLEDRVDEILSVPITREVLCGGAGLSTDVIALHWLVDKRGSSGTNFLSISYTKKTSNCAANWVSYPRYGRGEGNVVDGSLSRGGSRASPKECMRVLRHQNTNSLPPASWHARLVLMEQLVFLIAIARRPSLSAMLIMTWWTVFQAHKRRRRWPRTVDPA